MKHCKFAKVQLSPSAAFQTPRANLEEFLPALDPSPRLLHSFQAYQLLSPSPQPNMRIQQTMSKEARFMEEANLPNS